MNKVILMGRLTRNPDVRYSQGEKATCVARYTLAVNRRFRREGDQDADFINCVAFGRQGEFAEKYLKQGTKIVISGRIQTGSYTNRDGVKVYTTVKKRYGFEYNAECIVTEWLYRKSLKTNRTMTIFERTTESTNLGAAVRKECDVYKEQIPEETLALSFFNKLKLKTDIFQETYEGVMDTLVVQTDFCEDVNI